MFLIYGYFNQINVVLVIIKDFFQKHYKKNKNLPIPFNVKKIAHILY